MPTRKPTAPPPAPVQFQIVPLLSTYLFLCRQSVLRSVAQPTTLVRRLDLDWVLCRCADADDDDDTAEDNNDDAADDDGNDHYCGRVRLDAQRRRAQRVACIV